VSTALADLSLEQQVALLSEAEQDAILAELELDELPWDWDWLARPSQKLDVHPVDYGPTWELAAMLAGRGWGKTQSGSEWIRQVDERWYNLGRDPGQDLRVALLGRTAADVRDTLINGRSGLLNIYPPSLQDKVEWISSQRRVNLPNGGFCLCFSADEPDQLRGPQFHISWGDEVAAYKQVRGEEELDAWTNLRIATRLGNTPQVLATTTPKRVPLLRSLLAEIAEHPDTMILRRGRTTDNVHLPESYIKTLFSLYGGTALGAQELEGVMLDRIQGATTDPETVQTYRVTHLPSMNARWARVVAVDPSVAEKPTDECGIVVIYAPLTFPILNRHAFVIEDLSGRMSPTTWGDQVVQAAVRHRAVVVVENNQGGGLVRRLVAERAAAADMPKPPIREVWSSKSKQMRAEPVGAAYKRGRIHHLNVHPDLEDQLTSWTPKDSGYSPDRLDALVHGASALLFPEALVKGGVPGAAQSHSPVGQRLPRDRVVSERRQSGLRVDTGSRSLQRVPGLGVPSGHPGLGAPRRTVGGRW
jgi:phage terminase large subunit-like protein